MSGKIYTTVHCKKDKNHKHQTNRDCNPETQSHEQQSVQNLNQKNREWCSYKTRFKLETRIIERSDCVQVNYRILDGMSLVTDHVHRRRGQQLLRIWGSGICFKSDDSSVYDIVYDGQQTIVAQLCAFYIHIYEELGVIQGSHIMSCSTNTDQCFVSPSIASPIKSLGLPWPPHKDLAMHRTASIVPLIISSMVNVEHFKYQVSN